MKLLILIAALCVWAGAVSAQDVTVTPKPVEAPFLMEITDIYNISGIGAVVNGRIERGTIRIGERVEVVGFKPVNITTVSMLTLDSRAVQSATAGDAVGLVLKGVPRDQISRGQLVIKPGSVTVAAAFQASIDMFASHERGRNTPIATGYRPHIVFRTVPFSAVVTLPTDKPTAAPGIKGLKVTIELNDRVGIEINTKFSIRDGGREVGTGIVTAIVPYNE